MDVVLVGPPGSGKTAVGRRLASRRGAEFIELDEAIQAAAGTPIASIFAEEGEAGFRARERRAIDALGAADRDPRVVRVIASGGGAVVDPRNRWALYRDRIAIWLDGRPEVLAQRLRNSRVVRPLVQGRDPIGAVRQLSAARARFYGAAAARVSGVAEVGPVLATVDAAVERLLGVVGEGSAGTTLLRAETAIGRIAIGSGNAGSLVVEELARLGARRAVVLTEPGAWTAAGDRIRVPLDEAGVEVVVVMLPAGEDAKRLAVVESVARELTRLRVERADPLVVVGGGALGDAAGFVAATYLRGIRFIQVPTTLVAQIDASIGGKTAVDLPEGKNLIGAFHQPSAIVIDVALLATLPERDRRAALAEAVKMAALGDERLFEVLETTGSAIAEGRPDAFDSGAIAELVERAAWAKVEVVLDDERESGRRISLNLGHSLGHAVEAAAGFAGLRHGEAVAYGLRAASRIGLAVGATPAERAARIESVLDRLDLARAPLPYPLETVLDHLTADKKHAAGRLRWVLPTADGHVVRDDVPDEIVRSVASEFLAPVASGADAVRA